MNYPNRIIKAGETNATVVKAVQRQLNEAGLGPVEETGIFGSQTTNAVKVFQATHRDQNGLPLEIDGKLGPISWAVLFGMNSLIITEDAPNPFLTAVIKVAQSQLGVMEEPPLSNRGKTVEQYQASVGISPGSYWCAAFIYWCFQKTADNLTRKNPVLRTGHCMTHWNQTPGKKILAADAVNKPSLIKPGHIFIINTGGTHGHTGLIEKVEGGFIHTIEGNSDPSGGDNGIGVFRNTRKIVKINRGFIEYK